MNIPNVALEVSLALAVIIALICCLGLAVMPDPYEKMHYMATVSTISGFFVLVAVVIKEGAGQAAIKTSLILILLLIMNAVLTHATARAARVRTFGTWIANPNGPIPEGGGVGEKLSQQARELNEC